jgi:type II secretory pathway predicted ATPase ExeA
MDVCRHTFGLSKNPFGADLPRKDILVTPVMTGTKERIDYAMHMGGVALITGEIGSGKSTILRYLIGGLHPAEYQVIAVTACSGSILELYRQILAALGITKAGASRAMMAYRIQQQILDLVIGKKMKTLLVIDEASLLRLDVFAELHTLTQFEQDSKPYLPVILAGQANLVDNLSYRASKPLASRVVTRCHLAGIDRSTMENYLRHHLHIAGCDRMLFEEAAVTAIHQGSGGLYRKANFLARGALIVAARNESPVVTAEHVQAASTEIF